MKQYAAQAAAADDEKILLMKAAFLRCLKFCSPSSFFPSAQHIYLKMRVVFAAYGF
jgi:hypothetical protein